MKFSPILSAAEVEAECKGRFSVVTVLPGGEGGQGIVFKATANDASKTPPQVVALKIYYPGSLTERTKREVEALGKLRCDTLVKLHTAGHMDLRGHKCMFVATEFVEGETLSSLLNPGPLSLKVTCRVAHDVALAIHSMWVDRLVHRDIKPPNIMLNSNGRAILIDLGVARHLSLGSLTTIGKTWGTEGYMSPEQANALRMLSCKSDVFALGLVVQELLLGRHPTGHSQMALSGGGVRTAALGLNPPPEITAMIDAMLAFNPTGRPDPSNIVSLFSRFI